ncbi:MAG: transcription-repair coupling factor, partial [Rikenellaceae bacterium]|nr:transcription-repair coupling factor [Rikenellaceae bacterium]
MTPREQLLTTVTRDEAFIELNDRLDRGTMSIRLESLAGSAYTVAAAATIRKRGGVHILVADDRDAAAYAAADLYALLDAERVMFLPTSYKRSIQFGQEDAGGSVQRTAALNAIRNFHGGYLAVCTYPEALAETVVAEREMNNRTITVSVGEHLSHETLVELLEEAGFERVDFVYEPGQYSRRGGIVDLFSYSESRPFRVDFFGDEVDSIRSFEISSQLSKERLNRIEIIPNLREVEQARVSVAEFAGAKVCYWIDDPLHAARRMNDIRKRLLSDGREQSEVDERVVSGNLFMADSRKAVMLMHRSEGIGRVAECTIDFATSPQPAFNKNFALLADDLTARAMQGFTSYILSENKAQIERLTNVFRQTGRASVRFSPLSLTLHEGFVWPRLKMCCYTDHQIFDRYHRYRLRGEIARDESLTVAELNALKVGDYVVHVDHGVGRFGGLVKTVENGKQFESIKLVYRDGDVLLVNVHSLHRIARYKAGDSEPPKIYKLGTGAWQKLKNATKKAVKDIARELIALYAKRKATPGFAFSADGYLQHELEASFEYEDTPDQQKAVEAIKQDMESTRPMDRLVC